MKTYRCCKNCLHCQNDGFEEYTCLLKKCVIISFGDLFHKNGRFRALFCHYYEPVDNIQEIIEKAIQKAINDTKEERK